MQPRLRYPRIERQDQSLIEEDGNAHLWAVSYSDFLMTLLCFFILFFSLDESSQKSLILTISQSFQNDSLGTGFSKNQNSQFESGEIEKNILDSFGNLNISLLKEKNSLLIQLPEEFFAVGQHKLSPQNKKILRGVFENLVKYKNDVKLYFEGHTDDRPLHRQISNITFDNYLLGSLRAATALEEAKSIGFDEKEMYIQTTSSHQRNSRTLSLRIEPKEVKK